MPPAFPNTSPRPNACTESRHGEPISAVVTIEDYRLIELLRAAIPQHAAPTISEATVVAWAEDDDVLTQAEVDSIGREGSWQ